MARRPGSPPVAAKFRRALRWLGLVALWLVLLPATPMCALPRVPASGPEVAILSTGPFCAKSARDVQVSGDHMEFNGVGRRDERVIEEFEDFMAGK